MLETVAFIIFAIIGIAAFYRSRRNEYRGKTRVAIFYALIVYACMFFIGLMAGPFLVKMIPPLLF